MRDKTRRTSIITATLENDKIDLFIEYGPAYRGVKKSSNTYYNFDINDPKFFEILSEHLSIKNEFIFINIMRSPDQNIFTHIRTNAPDSLLNDFDWTYKYEIKTRDKICKCETPCNCRTLEAISKRSLIFVENADAYKRTKLNLEVK